MKKVKKGVRTESIISLGISIYFTLKESLLLGIRELLSTNDR